MTLTKERKAQLSEFCDRVGIVFKNLEDLDQAFHHRSLTNEQKGVKNNERLEFLGDSVLGMVTASFLYKNSDNPEGDLAKIKSSVVSEKALAPEATKKFTGEYKGFKLSTAFDWMNNCPYIQAVNATDFRIDIYGSKKRIMTAIKGIVC